MARLFEIEELRTLATRALLDGGYEPSASARVRAVPDTRTIRYYTTLGLISPPAEMKGRTAYYDEQHVLQLVAIKQLQAGGATLAEVQRQLVGLTTAKLQAIAKLSSSFWDDAERYLASRKAAAVDTPRQDESQVRDTDAFWLATPALPGSSANETSGTDREVSNQTKPSQRDTLALLRSVIRLPLPGDVSVLIELQNNAQANNTLDLDALMTAAKPLIQELRRQKLIKE